MCVFQYIYIIYIIEYVYTYILYIYNNKYSKYGLSCLLCIRSI